MAAEPMPERLLAGGVYEQVQFSQLGLPDIDGECTTISAWGQALELFRHGLGFVR